MMGLPFFRSLLLPSIEWIHQVPLDDKNITRVTLEWQSPLYVEYQERRNRVIIDHRRNTFITALSAIGGLIATAQGFHLLFFGRPLWWGLFGSKLLSPFGVFPQWSYSEEVRNRMIARYGFIPAQERTNSDVRGLSLFLGDFVMDTGPLFKRDEDLLGVGGGNAGSGDEEAASESIALVQRRAVEE